MGSSAVTLDVTDRCRRAEQVIKKIEARLRAITDNLPGGMVYQINTDREGTERRFLLYLSQSFEIVERLLGGPASRRPCASSRKSYIRRMQPRLADAEEVAFRRIRRPFDGEVRFRRADGELRWGRVHLGAAQTGGWYAHMGRHQD